MKGYRYRSPNGLNQVDFHDAVIESIRIDRGKITLHIESVNILPDHPLNPYDVAKNTDRCALEFCGVERYESVVFENDKQAGTAAALSGIGEFEILKLERQEAAEHSLYKIFGISAAHDQAFAEIRIEARHTIMGWNEYVADAWFVDWPERKERS